MSPGAPLGGDLLDRFVRSLEEALAPGQPETEVRWNAADGASAPDDLKWWRASSGEPLEGGFAAGASAETWERIGRAETSAELAGGPFEVLTQCLAAAIGEGAALSTEAVSPDAPPPEWARYLVEILESGRVTGTLFVATSLLTETPVDTSPAIRPAVGASGAAGGGMGRLMHVEVPVTIAFGRTQVRIKDLLSLNAGSVVELDQSLGDRVEVRVNNCLIAHGEVVDVAGNYGVRILEMVTGPAERD